MSEPHEMIEPHWEYSKGFLSAYLKGPIEFGEYCYKQAFAHGMKHQREIDEASLCHLLDAGQPDKKSCENWEQGKETICD